MGRMGAGITHMGEERGPERQPVSLAPGAPGSPEASATGSSVAPSSPESAASAPEESPSPSVPVASVPSQS